MSVTKAVIPAAGLGTRFLPATKALPKEMLPIVDTPVIEYVVEEALASGLINLLVVTRKGKTAIEDYLDAQADGQSLASQGMERCRKFHFVRQSSPLGLGHAVLQSRLHVGSEPFALLLGDEVFRSAVPCIGQVIRVHEKIKGSVLAVQEVAWERTQRYGIVDALPVSPGIFRVRALMEKPEPSKAPSNLAIVGRYVLEPEVFDALEGLGPGAMGEIQLTDALQTMVDNGSRVYAVMVQALRYDTGDRLGLLKAIVEFALAREDTGPAFRRYLGRLDLEREKRLEMGDNT